MMPDGNQIMHAISPLLNEGEFIVQAIVLVHVVNSDGEDFLRLLPTEMPWWSVNGMLTGASILVDDIAATETE